jgi:hypothetical protein
MYELTEGDLAIIRKASDTGDPNWFFNYYLRSPSSGTWWREVKDIDLERLTIPEFHEQALRWRDGYNNLRDIWLELGKPEFFAPVDDEWRSLTEEEYEDVSQTSFQYYRTVFELQSPAPVFHHNHGFLFLPWQAEMHKATQFIRVVCGGFGSGKTMAAVASFLYYAAVLRGFVGLALTPNSTQAEEIHKIAMNLIVGTKYEERFLKRSPLRPRPTIQIEHDYIGESSIVCIPIGDDYSKARTLTGDAALIDQAEDFQDIDELLREIGSRFRGQTHGRPKLGTMTLLANSAVNAALWDLYDEAEENPGDVWAFMPPSTLNIYLTIADMLRYQRYVGNNEENRRMYIYGERPIGSGEHFSAETLKRCKDDEWTTLIKGRSVEDVQSFNGKKHPTEGWIWREMPKIGCYYFETPLDEERQYCVFADPGWGNPPKRNAAFVGVFDVTEFPKAPALLVAGHWVFGHNDPQPWMFQYMEWVTKYRALALNGFDATGQQSGYEKLPTGMSDYNAQPISMGGGKKFGLLTLLKLWMSKGLLRFPYMTPIFNQLIQYRLPDDKLAQDIVSALLVATALLEYLYYSNLSSDIPETPERLWLPSRESRHARVALPRYVRKVR